MAADDSTELLPVMGAGVANFDNAMRGYDKRQVDDYVSHLEADLLDLKSERDLAMAASAERAAQLAGAVAHIESVERSLARADQVVDSKNVTEHVAQRLEAAQREAAGLLQATRDSADQLRSEAQTQADALIAAATAEAARIVQSARADAEADRLRAAGEIEASTAASAQRIAEADQKIAQLRLQAGTALERANADAGALLLLATTERDRLDAESRTARQLADETSARLREQADSDFEITLRARRSAATQQAETDLNTTRQTIETMLAQARAEVDTLHSHRNELHRALIDLSTRIEAVIAETAP